MQGSAAVASEKDAKITAVVNKIIPFSSVDGPGNRTAIFLQGCNINCVYCHNPETRGMCINCGECVKTCPANALAVENGRVVWNSEKCCGCDTCIHTCKHDSSPRTKGDDTRLSLRSCQKTGTLHPRHIRVRRRVHAAAKVLTGAVHTGESRRSGNPHRQ